MAENEDKKPTAQKAPAQAAPAKTPPARPKDEAPKDAKDEERRHGVGDEAEVREAEDDDELPAGLVNKNKEYPKERHAVENAPEGLLDGLTRAGEPDDTTSPGWWVCSYAHGDPESVKDENIQQYQFHIEQTVLKAGYLPKTAPRIYDRGEHHVRFVVRV